MSTRIDQPLTLPAGTGVLTIGPVSGGAVRLTGVELLLDAVELPVAAAPVVPGALGGAGGARIGVGVAMPAAAGGASGAGGATAGLSGAALSPAASADVGEIIAVTSLLTRLPMSGLSWLAGPHSIAGLAARELGPGLEPAAAPVGASAIGVQTSAWVGIGPATAPAQARPLGTTDSVAAGLPTASAPAIAHDLGVPAASLDPAAATPTAQALGVAGGAAVGLGTAVAPLQAGPLGDLVQLEPVTGNVYELAPVTGSMPSTPTAVEGTMYELAAVTGSLE